MSVSGSRNWIVTRNDIIKAAYRKVGVVGVGQSPKPAQITDAAFALNAMVHAWQNEGVFLWQVAEEWVKLTAGTANYNLGSGEVLWVENPVFRRDDSDTDIGIITKDEYYRISEKKDSGDPISIYPDYQLTYPTIYVWPVPAYSTSVIVGTDANNYLCIKNHTSAAANKPITGADYATYWQQVTVTGATWATATAYYSDVIRYSKVLRLQDFDSASDNPDFPVRWTQALIWGLAFDLSHDFGLPDPEKKKLSEWARFEFLRAQKTNYDNTDLRIIPARR